MVLTLYVGARGLYTPPQGRKWPVQIEASLLGRGGGLGFGVSGVCVCVSPMLGPSAVPGGRGLETDVGVG